MAETKQDLIDQTLHDLNNDGVDRRGFLKCMAWAGTGLVWTLSGGVPVSKVFAKGTKKNAMDGGTFTFVQISDSHIGFDKPANPDVTATLQVAIDKINALPKSPDFMIHTGDLSHLSKPSEFDTLDQAKFKSAALDTDDKFEFTFAEAGEYPFYCRIHPKMTGKIVVQI